MNNIRKPLRTLVNAAVLGAITSSAHAGSFPYTQKVALQRLVTTLLVWPLKQRMLLLVGITLLAWL